MVKTRGVTQGMRWVERPSEACQTEGGRMAGGVRPVGVGLDTQSQG